MCSHCSMWIHMCCDPAVTPKVYTQHVNEPSMRYLCPMCEYDRTCEIISDEDTVIPVANAPQENDVIKDVTETSTEAISGVTDETPGVPDDASVKNQEPSTSTQTVSPEDSSTKGKSAKGQNQKGKLKAAAATNQNQDQQISIITPSTLAPSSSTTPPDPTDLSTAQPTQKEGRSTVTKEANIKITSHKSPSKCEHEL